MPSLKDCRKSSHGKVIEVAAFNKTKKLNVVLDVVTLDYQLIKKVCRTSIHLRASVQASYINTTFYAFNHSTLVQSNICETLLGPGINES